jgi:fructose-bisphosphate aldolase class I
MAASLHGREFEKMQHFEGFIAALDQSGGSTPKALKLYGVPDGSYVVGEKSMYDAMHCMRERIITSPKFNGDRILGAILFEDTVRRGIRGMPTVKYLWEEKGIVSFLKIDEGLMELKDGVQMMKEMKKLNSHLDLAVAQKMFGTKARSFIKHANEKGIKANVEQQFTVARAVMTKGLHPIIEPEVDIHLNDQEKQEAERMLKESILENLNKLEANEKVFLKLTIPTVDNFYEECIKHPNVIRVVALSGGYDRDTANSHLSRNENMVASFSRALTEGLKLKDATDEFDTKLDDSIAEIFFASNAGI